MTTHELLDQLAAVGVRVSVRGDRLRFEGATHRLSPAVRDQLAARKAALIAVLAAGSTRVPGQVADTTGSTPPRSLRDSGAREENEANEAMARLALLERLRAGVSVALRRWDDDHLLALLLWHLVVAWDRGGEQGWRRYLPPALEALSDDEIATLVDWSMVAGLERAAWHTNLDGAATLSRGGRRLATWWNARRGTRW